MKPTMPLLIVLFGLVACERATVVSVPAPAPPAVVVPGPPGPAGATGSEGAQGSTGATGKTGSAGEGTTVVVMPPAASAPAQ